MDVHLHEQRVLLHDGKFLQDILFRLGLMETNQFLGNHRFVDLSVQVGHSDDNTLYGHAAMYAKVVHNALQVWFGNLPEVLWHLYVVVIVIVVPLLCQMIDHHQHVVIVSVAVHHQPLCRMFPQPVENQKVLHRQLAQHLHGVSHQALGILLPDLLHIGAFVDLNSQVFCQVYQFCLGDVL